MKNKLAPPQRPELNTEKTRFISLNSFEKYQTEKKNWKKWTAIGSALTLAVSLSLFFVLGKKEAAPVLTENSLETFHQIRSYNQAATQTPQAPAAQESETIIRVPASEQGHLEDYFEGEEQYYDVAHEDHQEIMAPPQNVEQP